MLCSEKKSADRRAMASGVRCMAYEMGERSELYTSVNSLSKTPLCTL